MASNAIKCFRTITRCGIFHQSEVDGDILLTPVSMSSPPNKITLNPGDSIEEPQELALDGRMVIAFSYPKEQKPELEIEWSLSTMDVEALVHGRLPKAQTSGSSEGWVYVEFLATATAAYPARAVGQLGKGILAQTGTSKAQLFYVDPATKLAKKLTIVTTTPATINEVKIDADLAITIHADLADTGYIVYGWVPHSFTNGTILSATPTGIMTVVAQGISFDNKARLLTVRNASRLPGGSVGSESTRQVKLRVLSDSADGTGLGYQIIDLPTLSVV